MWKQAARAGAAYGFAAALSLLVLVWAMRLWNADLRVPFIFWFDSLSFHALVKGTVENGWYLHNPRLGAPGGLDFHDYPMADSLHFVLIKLMALVWPDSAAVFNVYFVLTFPLATLSALFVFRHFGLAYVPALVGSQLFAFLPYHLLRNQSHLLLSAYYLIPLAVLIALWLWRGEEQAVGGAMHRWGKRRAIAAVVIALLVSSAGVYYAAFSCFFWMVAGAAAGLRQRRLYPPAVACLLIVVVGLGGIANFVPSFRYHRRHGPNPAAVERDPVHAEIFGLRVPQLLLPITPHRDAAVAEFKAEYNQNTLFLNENDTSSLGLAGSCGFLVLVGALLSPRGRLMEALSMLNAFALLLAGVGGFGALASWFGMSWLRGYCRICVFTGFFSLFAVVLVLDWLQRRYVRSQWGMMVYAALAALGLAGAFYDQTPTPWDLAELKTIYRDEEAFVHGLEESLPHGAMVFQLPYLPFPEPQPSYMQGLWPFFRRLPTGQYDHLRGYLHSRTLRWSFGCMKGRSGDIWYAATARLPAEAMLRQLVLAGFRGICVQRGLCADHGGAIEAELTRALAAPPIIDGRRSIAFFHLEEYAERLRQRMSETEWRAEQNRVRSRIAAF